jgi:formylglycine-generating enzyme required for sulfatase activity
MNRANPLHPSRLLRVNLNDSVDLEMIWVSPGAFNTGSEPDEEGQEGDREQVQKVVISEGFFLGKFEVSQLQYESVMKGVLGGLSSNPSHFVNPAHPVEQVSWHDVMIFLDQLNQYGTESGFLPEGWRFTLPSESEWEYACRAGTQSLYSWGNTIRASDANWHSTLGLKQTAEIGAYDPNQWGFYDMHGNVREWVSDWYSNEYPMGEAVDPRGPEKGVFRVTRGGSWNDPADFIRSADRQNGSPSIRYNALGFRICLRQD